MGTPDMFLRMRLRTTGRVPEEEREAFQDPMDVVTDALASILWDDTSLDVRHRHYVRRAGDHTLFLDVDLIDDQVETPTYPARADRSVAIPNGKTRLQ